ncbi:restriction endonuclease subunit S [Methylosinus sporium]|nr:restriction endonuclease subunit S [Methylosinus sporium]
MNVKSIALSEVAEFNPPAPALAADEEVSFVPMAAVSELGVMHVTEHARVADLKSGYSYMRTGDVLVAKITPCFENNKIAVASLDRPHGYGSTEFHVIRPRKEKLEARFLVHFLRQDQIRTAGERRMTGSAGQRRVPKQFLGELAVPLPPLDEQRRIAAILDQADDLRRKRREALGRLEKLSQMLFLAAVGEDNSHPHVKLSSACELITDGTHYTPTYAAKGTIFLSARNVVSGVVDWDNIKFIPDSLHMELQKRISPRLNDVLLAKNGTTGVAALVDRDLVFDIYVSLALLRAGSSLLPQFLLAALNSPSCKKQFDGALKGIGVPNLHLKDIREAKIPLPPLPLQHAFAARVAEIDKLKAHHRAHLARLDALFACLQHRAFRGDLSAPSFSRAREKAASRSEVG